MSETPHSSEVALGLEFCESRFSLSHVGPAWIIVKGPVDNMQCGPARLVVSVDGHATVQDVFLPDGIQAGERPQVRYIAVENGLMNGNGHG